ncbi:TetR/AcrR family transcriptional regulator [Gottfriedia solisilvae]|uniref:TetR family transcriptional regulator n=1 Tax=Gottfriedia solisilvae TaxID=1516104 RepID=A0A8J3AL42_9BACI|nr:TetR/AcrR family transcriptional regulator [Gottfriedia solisilvae]GGI12701.1 TetR family transcriptional regulator [Gottfriedia solisilvae]
MKDKKVDPRSIRTRRLLIEAFLRLTTKKDFKEITIKDITDEATVNRATFYSHFLDKYDLMDAGIIEDIIENVVKNLSQYDQLNEESIINIFVTLTKFHTDLATQFDTQCRRSYASFSSIIEQKLKKELEKVFYSLFLKQQSKLDLKDLKIGAAVIGWGIYGASVDWKDNSSLSAEQYINIALPFIVTEVNHFKR